MRLSLAFFSFTALITASSLHAQTTVFSDNFNRAVLTTGAPTTYTTTVTAGDGGSLIASNSYLQLTNDLTGIHDASGRVSVSGLTSSYGASYNPVLSLNSGASQVVEWSANLRYNRATGSGGFGNGNYSLALVLASNRSDFTATDAQGYAIAYGNTGSPDPIRLIRFTGGFTGNTPILTDIVNGGTANTANVNNYASVRVKFDAATSNWSLFVRDDGASAWGDPSTVSTQIGAATVDTTYTNISLANFGFYWGYSTFPNQTADFDNYRVTVAPVPEPATILAVSGLSLCAIGCVRRCRKRVRQIFTAEVLPA